MKAKFGALVTSGSGKLGGHMFSQTPNGVIMKTTGSYSKKVSAIQTIKRINTKILMALWSQISFEQRTLWESSAHDYRRIDVFSEVRTFNGFQLFQKVNQNRVQLGLAPMLNPASAHLPTFPIPVTVVATATSLILLSASYNTNDIVMIYATSNLGNGISSVKKRMRFIVAVTSSQLASGINIIANYLQVFPPPVIGNNIHIGVKTVSAISYFSNKQLYSSMDEIGFPEILTPFWRLRGNFGNYTSTNGGLVWLGGTSGTGWSVTGSGTFTETFPNYLALPSYISVADRPNLFNVERFGNMVVTRTVPNGYYLIRIYTGNTFASLNTVGARLFNIVINGVVVYANLDVVALFGPSTLGYLEAYVIVNTGSVVIQFQPVLQNAIYRAIEVISLT